MKNLTKIHIRSVLVLLSLLLILSACGQQKANEENTTVSNYTKYSCENDETKAITYLQIDINPSFILGISAEGNVVSIAANNDDGEDVLLNYLGDYFNGVSSGVELENVLKDLAEAVKEGGYIEDTLDVDVSIISGNLEEEFIEETCNQVTTKLAEDEGIAASFELVIVDDETSPTNQNEEINDEELVDSNQNCDVCNGSGLVVCDLCNGSGTMVEIEEHEVEVRNDYVCPYCGGVGILDDGLHGGETAVCGYCGGEGKTGPESGDFRELAYDKEIVQEEVTKPCSRCNGAGTMLCTQCNGTGVIE